MEFARKENGFATPQAKLRRLQFGCLLAALAMIFAFFLLEDRASGVAYLLVEHYLTVPAMVFLGVSLCQELPRRNRWHLYAGVGDAAQAIAALEFGQIAFKLGAEGGVFDVVDLTLEALVRVVKNQTATLRA